MKCEQIKYNLVDYIENNIEERIRQEIEHHLKTCNQCEIEYIQTGKLLNEMSESVQENPSASLKTNFYKMLEAEKSTLHVRPLKPVANTLSFKHSNSFSKIAALLLVFLALGILIGAQLGKKQQNANEIANLRNEINELKQNVSLVSLNQPSASKRIQAIQTVNKQDVANRDLLDALINTMNTDANVNVRMTAMYALTKYSNIEDVRTALILSLKMQTDPLLQITLINILVEIQDARAKEPLQEILNNNDLPDMVKKQAETGLKTFI